jgi:hypothetical protein
MKSSVISMRAIVSSKKTLEYTHGMEPRPSDSLVLSYLELRKSLGIIGIALPFVLSLGAMILGTQGILDSISAYYYSSMGGVFIGSLSAIGVFLWSYRGYAFADLVAGRIASLAAIGLALFPIAPQHPTDIQRAVSYFHSACALLFFLALAYFALVLFRKTHAAVTPTRMKLIRNNVYLACGATILACVIVDIALHFLPAGSPELSVHPTFFLESLAILAFGISWLVKGEAILKDE